MRADEMLVDGIIRPSCFGYMPGFSDTCDVCTHANACEQSCEDDRLTAEELDAIQKEQGEIEDYGFDQPWER